MEAQVIPAKKAPKRWKKRLKRAIVWLVILALLGGGAVLGVGLLKQEYTVSYDGYTAAVGSISNALSFSGSMSLINSASYTAASDATVREVYFQPGDAVLKGDRLMRLSSGEKVEAEFDGTVNTLSVSAGDSVSSGDALLQIADFAHMQVSIRVDEYDISSVSVGQPCTVTATATEKTFTSQIAAINYISSSTGSVAYYTATAYVDVEAGAGVYPGMQATVTLPQEEAKDVVVLKMDALSFDKNNSAFVYMYDAAGALQPQYVEGGISNGNYVEIKSGLQSGDTAYVEAASATASGGISGMLSGLFGSTRVNAPTGGSRSNYTNGGNGNSTNFSGGTMPNFSGGGRGGTAQ